MSDFRIRYPLFAAWVVLAIGEAAAMWLAPGQETIPYHLAWIGLAIAYDLEVWSMRRTISALVIFTAVTGGILALRAMEGVVAWQELAEIPLMGSLLLLVMWNVRRRQRALAQLSQVAERDRQRAETRERLSRMTSHEMRTPATIAQGYAELLLTRETDPEKRSDLEVIQSELGSLVLASDRLVRMIRLSEQDQRSMTDLRRLLDETVERWHVVADRSWIVEAESFDIYCAPERVRACLDTLIENAVRYTDVADVIRVMGERSGDQVLIGVADSGPGLDVQLAKALNDSWAGDPHTLDPYVASDPKAQTGLGLTLVREAAAARGGRVVAGRSAEGGALLLMAIPVVDQPRPRDAGAHPRSVSDAPAERGGMPVTQV